VNEKREIELGLVGKKIKKERSYRSGQKGYISHLQEADNIPR